MQGQCLPEYLEAMVRWVSRGAEIQSRDHKLLVTKSDLTACPIEIGSENRGSNY